MVSHSLVAFVCKSIQIDINAYQGQGGGDSCFLRLNVNKGGKNEILERVHGENYTSNDLHHLQLGVSLNG